MFVTLQLTILERIPSKGKCCYRFSKKAKLIFMAEMMIGRALMRLPLYKAEHAGFKSTL